MATVDPLFAQWLQAASDTVVRTDAAAAARWGATAKASERVTGLATKAGAQDEADRQLAFFARGPFAIDVHLVAGTDWGPELGRVVTLAGDDLGYAAGRAALVIGVEVDRAAGTTELTVVLPLGPA